MNLARTNLENREDTRMLQNEDLRALYTIKGRLVDNGKLTSIWALI